MERRVVTLSPPLVARPPAAPWTTIGPRVRKPFFLALLLPACAPPPGPATPAAPASSVPPAASSAPAPAPRAERGIVTPESVNAVAVGKDGFLAAQSVVLPTSRQGVGVYRETAEGVGLVRFEETATSPRWITGPTPPCPRDPARPCPAPGTEQTLVVQLGGDAAILPLDGGPARPFRVTANLQRTARGLLSFDDSAPATLLDPGTAKVLGRSDAPLGVVQAFPGGDLGAIRTTFQHAAILGQDLQTKVLVEGVNPELHPMEGIVSVVKPAGGGKVFVRLGFADGRVVDSPTFEGTEGNVSVHVQGDEMAALHGDSVFVWRAEEKRVRRTRALHKRPASVGSASIVRTSDGRHACSATGQVFALAAGGGTVGPNVRCVVRRAPGARPTVELLDLGDTAPGATSIAVEVGGAAVPVHGLRENGRLFVLFDQSAVGGTVSLAQEPTALVVSDKAPRRKGATELSFSAIQGLRLVPTSPTRGWMATSLGNAAGFSLDLHTPTSEEAFAGPVMNDPQLGMPIVQEGMLYDGEGGHRRLLTDRHAFRLFDGDRVLVDDEVLDPLSGTPPVAAPSPKCLMAVHPDGRRLGGCTTVVVEEPNKAPWTAPNVTGAPYRPTLLTPSGVAWQDNHGVHVALPDGTERLFPLHGGHEIAEGQHLLMPDSGLGAIVDEPLRAPPRRLLAVAPGGKLVVSDQSVRMVSGRVIAELPEPGTAADFSGDGQLVIVAGGRRARLFDTTSGRVLTTLAAAGHAVAIRRRWLHVLSRWSVYSETVDGSESSLLVWDPFAGAYLRIAGAIHRVGGGDVPPATASRIVCRATPNAPAVPCRN